MNTVKSTCAYDFGEEFLSGVVHDGHMVAIPTNRTAHVQHQLGHELQNGTYLISRNLCGMIVTSIDSQYLVVLCSIGSIEIM